MKKSERVAQNGENYRCLECGIRSREIPTCEHCDGVAETIRMGAEMLRDLGGTWTKVLTQNMEEPEPEESEG